MVYTCFPKKFSKIGEKPRIILEYTSLCRIKLKEMTVSTIRMILLEQFIVDTRLVAEHGGPWYRIQNKGIARRSPSHFTSISSRFISNFRGSGAAAQTWLSCLGNWRKPKNEGVGRGVGGWADGFAARSPRRYQVSKVGWRARLQGGRK